ncbi:MAG: hypothetical protein ACRD3G_12250, partial [Vicinamibacterales bacterium]
MPHDQPPIPRDQWSPDRASLRMLLARYLPGFLGGGDYGDEDIPLPMEPGTSRDPRLPAPSTLDEIRGGWDVFKGLGQSGRDPNSMQPVARERPDPRDMTQPVQRGPAPSVDELRR